MPEFLFILLGFGGLLVIWRMRWLTAPGTLIAGFYGASLAWWGGWPWVGPLLVFFLSSSLLSFGHEFDGNPSRPRSSIQVLANGAVPWLMIFGYAAWPIEPWYWGFLGATAAATSDTWSTEIGMMSSKAPVDLRTWKATTAGMSGAVTSIGLVGAAAGALLVGITGMMFLESRISMFAIMIAGFVGALVDSALGATVQAAYRKPTGERTEEPGEGYRDRGWAWMTNDAVNVGCTLAGCGLGVGLSGMA